MPFSSLSAAQQVVIQLLLRGGPEFTKQAVAAGTAMKSLGARVMMSGNNMQGAARRTWLYNQALFTLRRYAFYATSALVLVGAEVVKLGFNYLSSMQQARVALKPLYNDTGLLQQQLNRLFQISKYSPFILSDLTIAFRQMYGAMAPLGITGETVTATIKSLTDALAFVGKTGTGSLNRAAVALQHMAFQGRLTGRTVQQLAMDGLPIYAILNKELGVTADQIHNIASLNLPTLSVLSAINKYIQSTPGYANAAYRISLGTVHGLFQVIRDSLSQLSGLLIKPAFTGFQNWLHNIAKNGGALDKLTKVAGKQGASGAILLLSQMITGHKGLGQGFLLLMSIAGKLGNLFIHVWVPAFVTALHALIIFAPILYGINYGLGVLEHHTLLLKVLLTYLAARFILLHSVQLGVLFTTKLTSLAFFGMGGALKGLVFMLTRATFSMLLFLATNPIGWAILLIGAMVILYFKWKAFHDVVNKVFKFMVNYAPLVAAGLTLAFGPIGLAVGGLLLIIKYWKQIKGFGKDLVPKKEKKGGKGNFLSPFLSLGVPAFAAGGRMPYSGYAIVGENGPELAYLPKGTMVAPNKMPDPTPMSNFSGSDGQPIVVQVVVDRKVIAEAVARDTQARLSRR